MTPSKARRLLKSILYRQKICQELHEMESQLISYIQSTNTRYLAGYEISVNDNHLILRKLKPLEWRQLKLALEGTKDD
ncbi:MAG: hypothetical protein QXT73_03020 [Candidatus Methanomethylicaceae archaeon]